MDCLTRTNFRTTTLILLSFLVKDLQLDRDRVINGFIRLKKKLLDLSKLFQGEIIRSSSTDGAPTSGSQSFKGITSPLKAIEQQEKASSRSIRSSSSSLSSDGLVESFTLIQKPVVDQERRISTDNESSYEKNKTHYRIIIYSSKDHDGKFMALLDSRIFIRLNNQTKSSRLVEENTGRCPSFESGENQTFEIDLVQDANEQPTKLTVGYHNSHITAGKWKIDKVSLQ